jgi:putative ABC transport system permease protein
MPLRSRLASAWRTLTRQPALDRDLDDEIGATRALLVERHLARGLDPAAAERAAATDLGATEALKDRVRDVRPGSRLLTWLRDVRLAWRSLWAAPGFALVAIVTLALGIGANTAIFSLVHHLLLQPLPFRTPDRLVFIWSDMTAAGYPRGPLSGPELADLREQGSLFEAFGAIWANTTALTGDREPQQLRLGLVTTNFFDVLGASAAVGRTFTREDESTAAPTAILLSAGLWRTRYGGDPAIVGRRVLVNGQPTTVVGVMPDGFRLLMPADASVPDTIEAWQLFHPNMTRGLRGQMFLRVVGRLKPGVSLEAASREVSAIAERIGRSFTEYGTAGRRFTLVALHADGVREIEPALIALFAGVGVLWLIACTNVAGLMVARASARSRETAMRMALGAGRARLFSACLAEGLVLAGLGAIAGLLTARGAMSLMTTLRPPSLDRIDTASIDPGVLAFTGSTTLILTVLLSLAPLSQMARTNLVQSLQHGGRTVTGGGFQRQLRAALVVVQIALGVVLLVSAGLLVRTFVNLQRIEPGFSTDGVLTFRVALPGSRYRTQDTIDAFSRELQAKVRALPGVSSVGAISHLPFDNLPNWSTTYLTEAGGDESKAPRADSRAVSPGFFETVGATLVEGRWFTEEDDQHGEAVAIVDRSLAEKTWPRSSALGRLLATDPRVTGKPTVWVKIVGVVGHLRHLTLLADVREQIYFPVRQANRNPMAYAVRTTADPAGLATPIRAVVADLDPELPVYDVRPLESYVTSARETQQFTMQLAALFAVLALVLATIGVYGVVAYSASRRRPEFAVRLALGAKPGALVRLVLADGIRLTAVGLVLGAGAALATSSLIDPQLFGVTGRDPVSYAIALPVLGLVALLASAAPAWRATMVDPVEGLRAE